MSSTKNARLLLLATPLLLPAAVCDVLRARVCNHIGHTFWHRLYAASHGQPAQLQTTG